MAKERSDGDDETEARRAPAGDHRDDPDSGGGADRQDRSDAAGADGERVLGGLVAAGLLLTALQTVAFTAVLTLPEGSLPGAVAPLSLGLSVPAAAAFGVDAARTDVDGWSPNPLVWAGPMLLPLSGLVWGAGVPVGVGLAYAARRYEAVRLTAADFWFRPAVAAGATSGVGLLAGLTALSGAAPYPVGPTVAFVLATALVGFTTPATYFDVARVRTRRAGAGDGWLLGGYHWVVAMSVPVPLRSVVAVVYAVRRRGLFGAGAVGADGNA